jgi:hypothetical protein
MLEVACPECRTAMPYVPELAGRTVFCLGCGAHFILPALDAAPGPELPQVLYLDQPPPSPSDDKSDPDQQPQP